MAEITTSESFDEIVEWAYGTLPQEIRELSDFPGIHVLDEAPENMLRRTNGLPVQETLGLYRGIPRTKQRRHRGQLVPNLIFVFRGPILRCSRGDLRAEVTAVVRHVVAQWLGFTDKEVEELGLARPVGDGTPGKPEKRVDSLDAENASTNLQIPHGCGDSGEGQEEPLRCVKCYSADVTCREVDKFVTYPGAWLNAVPLREKICTCRSCGYEWDDEDNM